MTERELLARTAELAADYLETLDTRSVGAARDYRGMLAALDRASHANRRAPGPSS